MSRKEIIWADSLWTTYKGETGYFYLRWYIEDGKIWSEDTEKLNVRIRDRFTTDYQKEKMYQWLQDIGYRPKSFNMSSDVISGWLLKCEGQDVSAFEDLVRAKCKKLCQLKALRKKQEEAWQKLYAKFDGQILGIDRSIDVYRTGFSVRIILRSDMTTEEKRTLLRENRLDLVKWAIGEIQTTKDFKEKIGDMSFYRPAEIIILKIPELEMKFEIKNAEVFEQA